MMFFLRHNPIINKEFRSRMRNLRTYILVTIFVGLLSISAGAVVFLLVYSSGQPGSIAIWQRAGQFVFYTIFLIELFLVSFIAPALTSGAISSEKEHKTFDLLKATLLKSPNIVLGKLVSALSFLIILIIASVPLYALAYTFGGVNGTEILIALLLILWASIFNSSIGLIFSSLSKRTLLATILSYTTIAIITFGLPIIILMIIVMVVPLIGFGTTTLPITVEIILFTIGWLILSVSPLSASILSEFGLLNNQSLWILELPISNGSVYNLPSPWIPFLIFSSILIVFSLSICVILIDRPDH